MAAHAQVRLPQVVPRRDFDQLVEHTPDGTERVAGQVVVDLEDRAVAVDHTGARGGGKGIGRDQAGPVVAHGWVEGTNQGFAARGEQIAAAVGRGVEHLAAPGHVHPAQTAACHIGGAAQGRGDELAGVGPIERRLGHMPGTEERVQLH